MGRKYLTEVRLAWDVDAVASIAGSSRLVVKMPSWPPGPLQVTPRSAARVSGPGARRTDGRPQRSPSAPRSATGRWLFPGLLARRWGRVFPPDSTGVDPGRFGLSFMEPRLPSLAHRNDPTSADGDDE